MLKLLFFYVVGNIVFWKFTHIKQRYPPVPKGIAFANAKGFSNLFECKLSNCLKVQCYFINYMYEFW